MNGTIELEALADALRDEGVEPSAGVLMQNPQNFWENLPEDVLAGVVETLDIDAEPDEVVPVVIEGSGDEGPRVRFVDAAEGREGPETLAPEDLEADAGGLDRLGRDAEPGDPGGPVDDREPGEVSGGGIAGSAGPDGPPHGDEPGPEGHPAPPGGGTGVPEAGGGPGRRDPTTPADDASPRPGAEDDVDLDELLPEPGEPGAGDGDPGDPLREGEPSEEPEAPPTGDDLLDVDEPPEGDAGGVDDLLGLDEAREDDSDGMDDLLAEASEPGADPGEPEVAAPRPDEPETGEPPLDEAETAPAGGPGAEGDELVPPEPEARVPPGDEAADQAPSVTGAQVVDPADAMPDFPSQEPPQEEGEEEEGLIDETPDIRERIHGPRGPDATEDDDTDRPLVTFDPPEDPELEVVERYAVNAPYAYIRILYDNEEQQYWYEAREPALTEHEETVLAFIEDTLVDVIEVGLSELTEGEAEETVEDNFDQIVYDYSISLTDRSREKLLYYMKRDFLGYAKIDVLMQDDKIEDISCDGPGISIFLYHREYESIKSTIKWDTPEGLDSFVIRLAQRSGQHISVAEPLLDATLPDGSRLNASLSDEVTSKGSTFTIRKFREDPFTPTDLVRYGTMDVTMMAFWWFVVQHGASAIYAGGTASGKTTSMNAINLFIPPQMKIVSIEDTREISLPHENWIPAFTRSGFGSDGSGGQKGEIDMFQLLKAALRQRPEYIMVGEVRGEEAYALFQAMATGHTAYGTMHADSPSSVIHRLESDPISVPRSLLEALDIISVQIQTRIGDKRVRRTKELVEIVGLDPHTREILTNEVFEWDPATDEFEFSGVSYVLERLQMELNMTDEELDRELERRKAVIRWLLQMEIDDLDEVGRVIATYYKDRDTLMERVWDDLGEEPFVEGGAGLASSDPGFGGDLDADLDVEMEPGPEEPAVDGPEEPAVDGPEEPAVDGPEEPAGADASEAPAVALQEPGSSTDGRETEPEQVALAEGPEGAGEPPDPILGAMAAAAGAADAPPFLPRDHEWSADWSSTPPDLDRKLANLAMATDPDERAPPEDHPTGDPPEPGPPLGTLAQAGDPDAPFIPYPHEGQGPEPAATPDPDDQGPAPGPGEPGDQPGRRPGELEGGPEPPDASAVDPPLGTLAQAGDPETPFIPYEGEEPEPAATSDPPDPEGPFSEFNTRPEDQAGTDPRRGGSLEGGPAGPAHPDAGEDDEAVDEVPHVGEALGLDPETSRRLEEAGYADPQDLAEATRGDLQAEDLDPDLRNRAREALDPDEAEADDRDGDLGSLFEAGDASEPGEGPDGAE